MPPSPVFGAEVGDWLVLVGDGVIVSVGTGVLVWANTKPPENTARLAINAAKNPAKFSLSIFHLLSTNYYYCYFMVLKTQRFNKSVRSQQEPKN